MSPARQDIYSQLLDRYHSDPDLRATFDETAAGLGVRVLTADHTTGLVLTAEADSPVAVTDTSMWLRIRGAADRMVYGVALGGVAAWCYPNPRAVREPGTRRVTAVDVDRLVREHAAAVEAGDILLEDGLGEAWQEYAHNRKQVAETPGGQLKRDCTVRMCEDVLMMLATFGLVVVARRSRRPASSLGCGGPPTDSARTSPRAADRLRGRRSHAPASPSGFPATLRIRSTATTRTSDADWLAT
jgi:hypothetical protein